MNKPSYEELRELVEKLYAQIVAMCDMGISMCNSFEDEDED